MPEAGVTLALRDVSKTFGHRKVLDGVSFDIRPGEVHGLMGQNGSGKSTLVKLLAGYHEPDHGSEIYLHGAVAFVHQDLALIPGASVLENFCVRGFDTGRLGRVDWRRNRRRVEAALARFDLTIRVDAQVATLSASERAFLAIARAVDQLPRVGGLFVLDEPTAYLPHDGVVRLMDVVSRAARSGVAVLFVSHDVEETLEVTDRVTVLRDGIAVCTDDTSRFGTSELVRHIVGHELDAPQRRRAARGSERAGAAMTFDDVRTPNVSVSALAVAPGEIVGLTGLLGSGFDEVLYAAFGAAPRASGRVQVNGGGPISVAAATPTRMIAAGAALIPADRPGLASAPVASATENLTMVHLPRFTRAGRLSHARERRWAADAMSDFSVRPAVPAQRFDLFSGGNQQKLVLAKWLRLRPAVLLAHEPTQGVDVGARQEIYARIREAADAGTAFVVASANYDELPEICDRVVVFRKGTVAGMLTGDAIDKHHISELCYGENGAAR